MIIDIILKKFWDWFFGNKDIFGDIYLFIFYIFISHQDSRLTPRSYDSSENKALSVIFSQAAFTNWCFGSVKVNVEWDRRERELLCGRQITLGDKWRRSIKHSWKGGRRETSDFLGIRFILPTINFPGSLSYYGNVVPNWSVPGLGQKTELQKLC